MKREKKYQSKVICAVCHRLRIVTVFGKEAREELRQEIARGYVCSDHETKC
jgi:hypothetical protein